MSNQEPSSSELFQRVWQQTAIQFLLRQQQLTQHLTSSNDSFVLNQCRASTSDLLQIKCPCLFAHAFNLQSDLPVVNVKKKRKRRKKRNNKVSTIIHSVVRYPNTIF